MKKIWMLAVAALVCNNLRAQFTVDFETFTLSPESYDNGSAGNGNFMIDNLTFSNFYDDVWQSWNGFTISNITDNITPGWANQYSAFTGSGNNSENYAVYYPEGYISIDVIDLFNSIDSFKITNTTYAAISMRDGDAFAKQFGSIYGPDGVTPDGTNGEDFFRVWVIAEGWSTNQKDSIEVYLADYRYSDNNQDYILDSWLNVDLTGFGYAVQKVTFRMESSDNGPWGINTPTYFAIDDVAIQPTIGMVEIASDKIMLYPNPCNDKLVIKGAEGSLIITALTGEQVMQMELMDGLVIDTQFLPAGVYVAQIITPEGMFTERFVKD